MHLEALSNGRSNYIKLRACQKNLPTHLYVFAWLHNPEWIIFLFSENCNRIIANNTKTSFSWMSWSIFFVLCNLLIFYKSFPCNYLPLIVFLWHIFQLHKLFHCVTIQTNCVRRGVSLQLGQYGHSCTLECGKLVDSC